MNFRSTLKWLSVAATLSAKSVLACAVCFGASDAPMARGMNWGIFTLLGVIGTVLCGIAGVGVFFVRRAGALSADPAARTDSEAKQKV